MGLVLLSVLILGCGAREQPIGAGDHADAVGFPNRMLGIGCLACPFFIGTIIGATVLIVRLNGRRRENRAVRRGRAERRIPRGRPALLCPECGTVLPGDAPEGLCPQCLLKGVISSTHNAARSAAAEATGAYSSPAAALHVAELAGLFPQLEMIELIGQGGMGAVYKARQPTLDRLVAVKVLPPDAGRDPAFAERFNREARALARLGHPNIVAVHDVCRAGDLYYFVMEYVDGVNLRQVLRDGQLTPEQALRIVPQICDALQYAHEEGVVHRDIKPENILLDRKGRVKIADFGLAKLLGRDTGNFTLTGSRQVMGTLYYMAPEQVERPLEVDHRADIYSLGVVFYEMLTGQLPVGRFPMPSEKAGTDAFLDEVVLHALEREPARRYQHAGDVKTDVESHTRRPPRRPRAASAADRVDAAVRAAWMTALIGLVVPVVVVSLAVAGTIVAMLYHAPGEDITTPLIMAWSIAALIAVLVVVRSLRFLRKLPLPIDDVPARAQVARAAGLIGLVVPLVVVALAVLGTVIAALKHRPGEDITIALVAAWSIAAIVMLITILGSLDVIRHLHWPTEDTPPPSPGNGLAAAATDEYRAPPSAAAARVRWPARALLLVGILHATLLPAAVLVNMLPLYGSGARPLAPIGVVHGPLAVAGLPAVATPLFAEAASVPSHGPWWLELAPIPLLLSLILGTLIIVGAVQLLHLGSYAWATTGAILAVLPTGPAWVVGLPVGIWVLTILAAPDVRAAFRRRSADTENARQV
jgi:tRNA A-37 threonylcarbamoyl transferase component Bud32